MGGVKNIWGSNIYHYINTFHYFFSLETQKSEMFLLRISLEIWMHQLLLADILVLERNFKKLFVIVSI